jgi:hypothetical protein
MILAVAGPVQHALSVPHHALFVITLLVELVALLGALRCRARFTPGDHGRTTWSLFAAFLAVRVIAELRLLTLYFDLVSVTDASAWTTFYVVVLRYLYTISDALAATGMIHTIRALRGVGLDFALRGRDIVAMIVVASLPVIAYWLRDHMSGFVTLEMDRDIVAYRLVAVTVTAIVAMLCIAILRYVRQMGGGALARVWGAVVLAGLARTASFVALAVISISTPPWGDMAEQILLLVFALAWLRATMEQRRLLEADHGAG